MAAVSGIRALSEVSFGRIWKQTLPNIIFMRPMTVLCWVCQRNSTLIQRSANLPEEMKSARLREAEHHIAMAEERKYYYEVTIIVIYILIC